MKKKRKNKGFTLPEVLVVLSIIVIISTFMIINFRDAEESGKLQRSAQLLVQKIRKAQNLAMSSVEYQGAVPGAYGIYMEKQSPILYTLFVDLNGNYAWNGIGGGGDGMVEELSLEEGIEIIDIIPGPKLHITFIPPDPSVLINSNVNTTDVTITLRRVGGVCPEDCRYVKLNNKGWVSVSNTP